MENFKHMHTQISIHENAFEIEYVFNFKVKEKSGSRILLRYESCGEIKKYDLVSWPQRNANLNIT